MSLLRRAGDDLEELFHWPDTSLRTATAGDLDGDGRDELYVGTGPYTRHLVELRRGDDGAWTTLSPAPVVNARGSDVRGLVAGDLDGDGRDELVVALGAWNAYELMILRHDATLGRLKLVTRYRLGNARNVALVRRRGRPPELAAVVSGEGFNPSALPPDVDPAANVGLHRFVFASDRLEHIAFAPSLHDPARPHGMGKLHVGDLDGDGDDELIQSFANDENEGPNLTAIYGADPEAPPLLLGETRVRGVADLDGDGDAELIVEFTDRDELWTLGGGDSTPPTIALAEPLAPPPDLDAAPPSLARRWRHAQEIERIGLAPQAAAALEELAALTSGGPLRAQALLAAAAIHESRRADRAAAELYRRAAQDHSHRVEATRGAARSFRRCGDFAAAAAVLDAALTGGGLSADTLIEFDQAREAAARRAEGDLRGTLDFRAPLDANIEILQPLALRRDAATPRLEVDAVTKGRLLAIPARGAVGVVALELDLDLERVEWGGDLELRLSPADGGPTLLALTIRGMGGGAELFTSVQCWTKSVAMGGWKLPREGAGSHVRRHLVIRGVLDPATGELTCLVLENGDALEHRRLRVVGDPPATGGALGLDLRTNQEVGETPWIAAGIRRVSVAGVDLELAGRPADGVAARLVERDFVAALADLDALPERTAQESLWRVVALLELARWEEARDQLRALFDADPSGTRAALVGLMHVDPKRYGPLVRAAAGPREHVDFLLEASAKLVDDDSEALYFVAQALADIEETDPPPPVLARYLQYRGDALALLGYRARARDDHERALALYDALTPKEAADPTSDADANLGALATARAWLAIDLAASTAAEGDLDRAAELLAPLLADERYHLATIDALARSPEFDALRRSGRLELDP